MGGSSGGGSSGVSSSGGSNLLTPHQHHQSSALPGQQPAQGLTALLVMIAVLCILLAYCFWGAPWCRAFCRRRVCCFCPMDEPDTVDVSSSTAVAATTAPGTDPPAATPTIILLPFGRMLVVDGAVFAQLQADSRGLDLMELGENIIRTQRYQTGSSPSIFQVDSETTSKGMSPILDGFLPPAYDSIFGSRLFINDMPPSYSEVSLQMRHLAQPEHQNQNQHQPQRNNEQMLNERNQRSRASSIFERRENLCPIAEAECDRIAASEEDIRESRV